jgi:DNA-binding NarL/FixJ family response regulator
MIRVVVADDHHLVRQGIRALLEKAGDIEVIGEAADGQEAVDLVGSLKPDVLVLDIGMPRLNGTQAAEKVQALDVSTKVVILSMYSDDSIVKQTLRCGVKGYLLKQSVTEELHLAIRAAQRGQTYLSPAVSESVLVDCLRNNTDGSDSLDSLTMRERETWQLIAEGNTNCEIAFKLRISEKTVEKHRTSLMSKLGVHDVTALVRLAIKHGVVYLDN